MSAFEIGSEFERQCLAPVNQLQTADATIRVQNLRTGSADSLRTSETIQLCIYAGNASRTIGYGSAKVSNLRSKSCLASANASSFVKSDVDGRL